MRSRVRRSRSAPVQSTDVLGALPGHPDTAASAGRQRLDDRDVEAGIAARQQRHDLVDEPGGDAGAKRVTVERQARQRRQER